MKSQLITGLAAAGAAFALMSTSEATAQEPEPERINRAIELLEQGQPVYYTTVRGGAGYDEGREMAETSADYITYEMEHGALDFTALRDFMRGLVDAGPTRTGHRTPTVIATLPIVGDDPESMRANFWVAQQALATGIHGILLVMAEDPDAVEILVEALRYPFAEGADADMAHRGSGSHVFASEIWGLDPLDYLRVADTWPLNPDGEIMLGLKIENPRGTENAEALAAVPGVGFVEWGPGDQSFYRLGRPVTERVAREDDGRTYYMDGSNDHEPEMVETRARVLAAAKDAGVMFLNSCPEDDVVNQIEEGTMICTGGDTPAAEIGREHTGRPQPW